MAQIPVGEELIRMSIEIEKNGHTFYSSLAEHARENEVKDKFAYLASQEQQHEDTFSDMLNRLSNRSLPRNHSSENYQYIKDLADSSIFFGDRVQNALAKKTMTDAEAIQTGIDIEKDSILFYADMRGMLPRDEQPLVDMITNEEKKHLSELTYIKQKIIKG